MTRLIGLILLAPPAGFLLEAAAGFAPPDLPLRAWGGTLVVAGVAAAAAVGAGVPVGLALAHARGRLPLALTILPLLMPPMLAASVWMSLGLPLPGPVGCGLLLAAVTWPAVALLLFASLRALPQAALDAAELHLPPGRALLRVAWPHARPSVLAGAAVVFLLSASDFTVPATFSVRTVSLEVYERLGDFRFGSAAMASLPLVAMAVGIGLLLVRIPAFAASSPSRPFLNPGSRRAVVLLASVLWGAAALVPLSVFAARVGSPGRLADLLAGYGASLAWTAIYAGATAAALIGWASWRTERSRLDAIWAAGLVLPGAVAGLGVMALSSRSGMYAPLAPSGVLLVWALAARFAGAAWLPLREPVDRAQLDAADLAGMTRARRWVGVIWPAVAARAAAAGVVVAALAVGEIGPAVLLSPPGRQPVGLHLFNWMHYGHDETAAALSLVLMAAAVAAAWGIGYAGRGRRTAIAR
jgi:iron(III) transport system permease protein